MQDPIATGSYFSGHGRGMSQWGSYWWAEGLSFLGQPTPPAGWQCILDHYYNDNSDSTGAGGSTTYRWSFIHGPGGDGLIAFDAGQNSQIYAMKADGSGLYPVTNILFARWPTWSPNQKLLAFSGWVNGSLPETIYTIGADGSGLAATTNDPDVSWWQPNWSKNGSGQLTVADENARQIWVMDPFNGAARQQLTSDLAQNADPFWSPDGSRIIFDRQPEYDPDQWCSTGAYACITGLLLGGGEYPIYTAPPYPDCFYCWSLQPSFSPDGEKIVFINTSTAGTCAYGVAIDTMNADGSGRADLVCASDGWFSAPHFTQDGRYIAFMYSPDGYTYSVNLMTADGLNAWQLTNAQTSSGTLDTTRCRAFDSL